MINWFETAPRRVLALICAGCVAGLGFGLYLQHVVGLEPCPMCIVQRYAMVLIGLLAGLTALSRSRRRLWVAARWCCCWRAFGAFVAARQSWLQWYPPEVATCGRDFYGMIESLPAAARHSHDLQGQRRLQAVDWTFLGGSIANWSFVVFCVWIALALTLIVKLGLRRTGNQPSYA